MITLDRNDLGQLLDGLEVLIDQWQATATYLTTGESDPDTPIRECSNADEAQSMVQTYRRLADQLYPQLRQSQTPASA